MTFKDDKLSGNSKAELIEYLQKQAATIRKDLLAMIFAAQSGHPGGSLSAADIMTALYFHFMDVRPEKPDWPDRDRLILSKGHACPVWYSCLAERGFFPLGDLLSLREINSRLQGHPDMNKTPGIDYTAGSLGQGLSAGLGIALGLKKEKKDASVYVILGDGELNEGQIWEAALSASKFKLDNLIAIIDYNNLQLDGHCDEIMPIEPLAEKWRAFNWYVQEIDGHNMGEILDSIELAKASDQQPSVIIARTVKGKGVSYMEDECDWHGKAPNREQFLRAVIELDKEGRKDALVQQALAKREMVIEDSTRESLSPLAKNWAQDAGSKPTRDAYGEVLLELGKEFPEIVVFEADISKSTRTNRFAERYPDRFYQFGVAEANMIAAAGGMASTGKIPFVSTYAVFASMRACEQVRTMIAYPNLNVKIAVSHGGITPANDGVTHQGSEDMGIIRTIPNMTVIMPTDYYSTKKLVRAAVTIKGPVYLRFTRDAVPKIYDENEEFEIGKGKILKAGGDISFIAIGDMVAVALEAAQKLESKGIHAEVIDMHTLKPIDKDLILASAGKTKHVLTIEDHQINNGLGSAVAEVLGEETPYPIKRIGLKDTFAESGRYDLLLQKYEMDDQSVIQAAERMLKTNG
jgi:transketolase